MKVALISPSVGGTIADGGLASVERNHWLVNRLKKHLFGFGETSFIPPMALLSLAAVTPSNVSLTIIDERLQTIDYDMDVDLVGPVRIPRRGELVPQFGKSPDVDLRRRRIA